MADVEFNAKMAKLEAAKSITEKVDQLKSIADMFKRDKTPHLLSVVKSSNLIKILAEVMAANKQQWLVAAQTWILTMAHSIYIFMKFDVPQAQTKALVEVAIEYLMATEAEFPASLLYAIAGRIENVICQFLYDHPQLHNRMKKLVVVETSAAKALCFYAQVTAYDNWKMRLLEDKQLLLSMIRKPVPDTWVVFLQLSKHVDAKEYIPQEVIQKASLVDDDWCPAICAALCNESNASGLVLNMTFVESSAKHMEDLLNNQNQKIFSRYSLFGLLFPLANLSVGDANKEPLGKIFIPLLKRALQVPKNCINTMINNLKLGEAKQLAAKILWNLAFTEPNRKRIEEGDGTEALKRVLESPDADDTLKKNIIGVLYMYTAPKPTPREDEINPEEKHIMISYNWDNQKTIKRLAASLKAHGFKIWLDVEQMKGSTLEAMAEAIEGASLVLICMSQKYKDSPNCRLEGEYCVNRKVPFIPLMLQEDYMPEGWLGIALGTKLFFKFDSEDEWDDKVVTLVKAITIELATSGIKTIARSDSIVTINSHPSGVETWSKADIHKWMTNEGIDEYFELFMQHRITGKALKQLKKHQHIIQLLKQMLDIKPLGDLLLIEAAIQKL